MIGIPRLMHIRLVFLLEYPINHGIRYSLTSFIFPHGRFIICS